MRRRYSVAASSRRADADEHGGPHWRQAPISLLVDEIGDVVNVDEATFERTPENLEPAARELIRGVYKLKDRLMLVLDTEGAAVDLAGWHDGSVGGFGAAPLRTVTAGSDMRLESSCAGESAVHKHE